MILARFLENSFLHCGTYRIQGTIFEVKKGIFLLHLVLLSFLFLGGAGLADEQRNSLSTPAFQEITGTVFMETVIFPDDAAFSGQSQHNVSLAVAPEYYLEWPDYTSITISPFGRLDSSDARRTHFDIRELFLRIVRDDWSLVVGSTKVFWGVTESKHLVDIINQTDVIENPNGESKFGQPMVNLSFTSDWGFIDLFVMPYFRERIFQSRSGRLRGSVLIDAGQARFDSKAERFNPDVAVRYSNSIGSWDVGLSNFYGTSREPTLTDFGFSSDNTVVLVPNYESISQTGLELQYTNGPWLWKLEGLFRQGQKNALGSEQNFSSVVVGAEYNFFGAFGTNTDVGVLAEYMRDSRLNKATDPLQHDIFSAVRVALNDTADTQALAGVVQDLQESTRQVFLEASTRINDSARLSLELQKFMSVESGDVLSDLRADDFIRLELTYYY